MWMGCLGIPHEFPSWLPASGLVYTQPPSLTEMWGRRKQNTQAADTPTPGTELFLLLTVGHGLQCNFRIGHASKRLSPMRRNGLEAN